MNKHGLVILVLAFMLSGCVVRTYPVVKDRVDQDLGAGNRGYLKGESAAAQIKERKTTRTTHVVEVELSSPIKFEKRPKIKAAKGQQEEEKQDAALWGNRGYVNEGAQEAAVAQEAAGFEKYTVEKGDTLQKISHKFYGTTKNWPKIYEANKGALKGPDKVYPGQSLNIPVEPLKEPKENLK